MLYYCEITPRNLLAPATLSELKNSGSCFRVTAIIRSPLYASLIRIRDKVACLCNNLMMYSPNK